MADATDIFQLDIEFAGMCMFVRDPSRQQMHVLLPPVGGHLARLFYAPEHGSGQPCQNGTSWPCQSLDGIALDLTGLVSGASSGHPVFPEVIDLSGFLGGKQVPRRHLSAPPPADPVLARVTLDDGGHNVRRPGIRWRFGAGRPRMAVSVTWRIPGVTAPLRLTLGGTTLELVPRHHQMKLAVFNAPFDELPDGPDLPHSGGPVHHFDKYYDLFDGVDPGEREIPDTPDTVIDPLEKSSHKGRRFTCITAQAEAEP